MSCNKIQSLISAYADRELTGVEMFIVRQHLHDCDACRAEEAELQRVRAVLNSLEAPTPSLDFENRLAEAVMGSRFAPEEVSRLRRANGIATLGLAAAAAVCFVFYVRATPAPLAQSGHAAVHQAPNAGSSEGTSVSFERDNAFISASDPLAGPQMAIAASYSHR